MPPAARPCPPYRNTSHGFVFKEHNYQQQFSHIYLKRLTALRPALASAIRGARLVEKLIALKPGDGNFAVIGTLYKNQKLKPSVLDEFQGEFEGKEPTPKLDNYVSPDDSLILEDESGRAVLRFSDKDSDLVARLVTGIVVAVIGELTETGQLVVNQLVFPGPVPLPSPYAPSLNSSGGGKLVIVGNAQLGRDSCNKLAAEALVDWIAERAAVSRVVFCGGSMVATNSSAVTSLGLADKSAKAMEQIVEPIRLADGMFAELASMVHVDVMSGPLDPCNSSLPQQAMHRCLFPRSSRVTSFQTVSNPYSFTLGGVNALGHSGQAVHDVLLYSKGLEPLNVMRESLLQWRHLAPTAPDTLACYPFHDRDPFVVEETPHLYFCSNPLGDFATCVDQGVRFVAVPDFARTGQCVEVDLSSGELSCKVVTFDVEASMRE